jgi:hypothetical protein
VYRAENQRADALSNEGIITKKGWMISYKLQVTSYKLQVTSYKLQVTSYKF